MKTIILSLNNKSKSIAFAIIALIGAVILSIFTAKMEGNLKIPFILVVIAFVLMAISSTLSFVKGIKYGDEKTYKAKLDDGSDEEKKTFGILNIISTICSILTILLILIGIVLFIVL